MASLTTPKTVTYEEWILMPETKNEEVVNGEIHIVPTPPFSHALIVGELGRRIRGQVDRHDVLAISAPFDLIIRREPLTTRLPDLAVFWERTIAELDGRVCSAPQLIVEVLSSGTTRHDRLGKLADYASLGVPEVWGVSPEARTVEVLYLENDQFVRHAILAEGILKPKLFPDVQIDIAEIWPD